MLRRCAVLFAALFLVVGLGACSDDEDSSGGSATPAATGGTSDVSSDDASPSDVLDQMFDEDDRAFGIDQEQVAGIMVSTLKADSFTIDGNTTRVTFKDGSMEDPMAHINCSVAETIGGPDDRFILEYPDGTLDCATRNDS